MTQSYELTQRQNAILDCVRISPNGIIKQRIVDALTEKGIGSRKTILKDINVLVDYGVVYVDKEKPNSQIHYIRVRNTSKLLSVINDLNLIRNSFSELIQQSTQTISEVHKEMKLNPVPLSNEELTIAHAQFSLQALFQHFIGICTLYSIFIWPKEVEDKKTLDKIYTIVFDTIKEIQIQLAEAEVAEVGGSDYMVSEITDQLFALKRKELHTTIINLEYIGAGEEAESVLDGLWKFGFRFVRDGLFTAYQFNEKRNREIIPKLKEYRDWRKVVKDYVDKLPSSEKEWSRAVSNKY